MKVLVTGANSRLAFDLKEQLIKRNHSYIGYSRIQMDITNAFEVENILMTVKPDVVIHCAAYTNVNKAEDLYEYTHLVNCVGTENVALISEKVGAKLVYISTDYIFDGMKKQPYLETDYPNPINIYGRSKWLGELAVKQHHSKYFIIRTSWIYGIKGDNFVKKILLLAKAADTISVVNDQIGSPTYSRDLAERIVDIMESDKYGVYHISNTGFCSRYEFSKKIIEIMDYDVVINPIKSSDLPDQAKRPSYSALCNKSLVQNQFMTIRDWDEALSDFLLEYRKIIVDKRR